jgi:hypothetical protein
MIPVMHIFSKLGDKNDEMVFFLFVFKYKKSMITKGCITISFIKKSSG